MTRFVLALAPGPTVALPILQGDDRARAAFAA
jgi:hypothetical protein